MRAKSLQTGREASGGRVLSMDVLDEYSALLDAVVAASALKNIPVTTMINEYGAGQFEVNLQHGNDPVRAADEAALLRRLIVGVARSIGKDATFMSKPFAEDADSGDAGSGMHSHLSLVDASGNNVFAPDYANADQTLSHVIGGMQAMLTESMWYLRQTSMHGGVSDQTCLCRLPLTGASIIVQSSSAFHPEMVPLVVLNIGCWR